MTLIKCETLAQRIGLFGLFHLLLHYFAKRLFVLKGPNPDISDIMQIKGDFYFLIQWCGIRFYVSTMYLTGLVIVQEE